jgi:hypothetical protein
MSDNNPSDADPFGAIAFLGHGGMAVGARRERNGLGPSGLARLDPGRGMAGGLP